MTNSAVASSSGASMSESQDYQRLDELSEGARKIVTVATRLFAEHGVEGVSIARIASEAGVGKATVFHHFPSKNALHHTVLWQVNQRALSLIEDRSWDAGDLESCMAGFVRDQLHRFESDEKSVALLRLVRREIMNGDPKSLDLLSAVIVEPFKVLRGHLAARQARGDLPECVDLDLLSWLLMEVGVSYHEGQSVLSRIPGLQTMARDPDRFSRSIVRILIHGCVAESGE